MYMYQIDSRQVWVRTLTVPNGHLDYPNKLSNLTECGGVLARKRSLFISFGLHFETINFRWASFGSEYLLPQHATKEVSEVSGEWCPVAVARRTNSKNPIQLFIEFHLF